MILSFIVIILIHEHVLVKKLAKHLIENPTPLEKIRL